MAETTAFNTPNGQNYYSISTPDSKLKPLYYVFDGITVQIAPDRGMSSANLPKGGMKVVDGVSGVARSGELMAVLGQSGAGKTSLLDTLAGRKTTGKITGSIKVNGHEMKPSDIRGLSAYVSEDTILVDMLTVRETLSFVALLQLSISNKERKSVVEEVITQLGLTDCADRLVGGSLQVRGISTGQRRRLSIGTEMLRKPRILFLDEPTSGLDSTTALKLFEMLKTLAVNMRTAVICTIHQPRYYIWKLIDQVLILNCGRTAYLGPPDQVSPYCVEIGNECPDGCSIADHILDVVSENQSKVIWADTFLSSALGSLAASQFKAIKELGLGAQIELREWHKATGFLWQVAILCWRSLLNVQRNPLLLFGQYLTYSSAACFLGLLFSDLQSHREQQLTQSLVFSHSIIAIFSFFLVPVYFNERAFVAKERASSVFRVSSYWVANTIVSVCLHVPIMFVYTYILFVLQAWNGNFGYYLSVNVLLMLCFLGMNQAIGSSCSSLYGALASSGVLSILFIVFSGTLVLYDNIPLYLRWLYWLSPCAYASSGIVLHTFDMEHTEESKKWLDIFHSPIAGFQWVVFPGLIGASVFFNGAFFLALMFWQKEKR